jgi:hypothetical protein
LTPHAAAGRREEEVKSMGLGSLWERQTDAKTPVLLKVAIVLQIWFLLSSLYGLLNGLLVRGTVSYGMLISGVVGVGVQIAVLIAIWRLRKWAVVAYGVLSLVAVLHSVTLVSMNSQASSKVVAVAVLVRLIMLFPALVYWNRMTWKRQLSKPAEQPGTPEQHQAPDSGRS